MQIVDIFKQAKKTTEIKYLRRALAVIKMDRTRKAQIRYMLALQPEYRITTTQLVGTYTKNEQQHISL